MGDRVLIQCVSDKTGEVGPVCYSHWLGDESPEIVSNAVEHLLNTATTNSVSVATATIVAEMAKSQKHNVECWSEEKRLTEEDTHGDAGIIVLNVDNLTCQCFGGYLEVSEEGLPVLKR